MLNFPVDGVEMLLEGGDLALDIVALFDKYLQALLRGAVALNAEGNIFADIRD